MSKLMVLPALFLLAVGVSAVELGFDLHWGQGVQHTISGVDAQLGVPVAETEYFISAMNDVSTAEVDAKVISDINVAGRFELDILEDNQECNWKGYIELGSDPLTLTEYTLAELDDDSVPIIVDDGTNIYWSATPKTVAVTNCVLLVDYRVMES